MNNINEELSQAPNLDAIFPSNLNEETKRSPLVGPVYSMNKNNKKRQNLDPRLKLKALLPQKIEAQGPLTRNLKATIAFVTVTASLIGAATTISSFAQSVAPVVKPVVAPPLFNNSAPTPSSSAKEDPDSSAPLAAFDATGKPLGQCPLTQTKMDAKLSGYIARVNVTQVFTNPYKERIEAVYSFPLSDEGAVDDMTIKIGERTIKGEIKAKEEAKAIYQKAKEAGNCAALLNQERTNIFTQQVANIEPGQSIVVQLSYVELLKFEDGKYTFTMPTAIGERFFPDKKITSDDTSRSASDSFHNSCEKLAATLANGNLSAVTAGLNSHIISSNALPNLSINVDVDAGMPIRNLQSPLFPIMEDKVNSQHSVISLRKSQNYPDKDFVLTYELDNPAALKSGYLAYRDDTKEKDGFATFMMMPPAKVTSANVAPKEMIFLVDCSGSQQGKPIEKAKETLHYIVNHMNAKDTFQILAFNDDIATLAAKPVSAGLAEKLSAHTFIDRINAGGGTWMQPAVERVLKEKTKADDGLKRLRIVTFMTDGFVGNDLEIISLVQKERKDSRWFAFGTGNNVNRSLIDNVSRLGGGEADYVLLDSSAEEVGKKFYERIASPALTDVKLKAEGLDLYDVFPATVSDVWANKPLYFTARYRGVGPGRVVLSGYANGRPYSQVLAVTLPDRDTTNSAIEKVWARQKITALTDQDISGLSAGHVNAEVKEAVTKVALKHGLMSDFTSFVAVDSSPSPAPALVGATMSGFMLDENGQPIVGEMLPNGDPSVGGFPGLQGATNGTISPQSYIANSGAQVVQGVNTCGTVRVNNLANLEALANLLTNVIEIVGIGWGLFLLLGFIQGSESPMGGKQRFYFALASIFIGLATPGCINWLFAIIRESSLFN